MGNKMLIPVGYELLFDVPAPTSMLLKLYLHPSQLSKVKQSEELKIEPDIPLSEFTDEFGNRVGRLVMPAGRVRLSNSAVVVDSGEPDEVNQSAQQIPVEELPTEVLPYVTVCIPLKSDRCPTGYLGDFDIPKLRKPHPDNILCVVKSPCAFQYCLMSAPYSGCVFGATSLSFAAPSATGIVHNQDSAK